MCAGGALGEGVEDGGGMREWGEVGERGGFARAMAQKGQVGFVIEGGDEEGIWAGGFEVGGWLGRGC